MDANRQAMFLRLDLEQQANTVVNVLPAAGEGWLLTWTGGPDETGMRTLVASIKDTSLPRITLDIQGYERQPVPDFAELATFACRTLGFDPDAELPGTGTSASADLQRRLSEAYEQHGYRTVHGMMNELLGRERSDPSSVLTSAE